MNNPTKIGIMVTIVLCILAILTIKTGRFNFSQEGYEVKVLFDNINGVNLSSPVMFNGYEMGVVKDIVIAEKDNAIKMELTLWLQEKARLREGSKALVKNLGLMGEKYISLTSGEKGAAYLDPGSIIMGNEPPDLEALLSDGQKIANDLKQIVHEVNEHLKTNSTAIDDILINISAATNNIASITANVDERLKVSQHDIDDIMKNFRDVSVNLEEMSNDLKINPWKLLYRSKKK